MLGVVDPYDYRLMTFNLDQREPKMLSTISFQVSFTIHNLVVHRCIIDEVESTCDMSTFVWKKLWTPTLQPSTTALRAYDGRSSHPQGILINVPIDLSIKMVLINIEVFNAKIDYNLLIGHSYMYSMQFVASTVFQLLMFPP